MSSDTSHFDPSGHAPTTPHIGIVGAGVSGLRSAEILLQHGFKVTILEARDRIGGRICQSDELGYTVDLGPNWIHTSDTGGRHPLVDLAHKTNSPLHSWNSKQNIYDSSGTLLSENKSDQLSTLLWKVIEEAQKYSAKNMPSIPESTSLYDYFVKKANELFPDGEADKELLCQMSEMWGAYIGEPIHRQSLRFAWMEEVCGGEEMFIETNYKAILAEIAKKPLEKATLLLKSKVIRVQTEERETSKGKVRLTLENGETLSFDEVIMTVPLGYLKRNTNIFEPLLPPRMQAGINAISVGHLEKVYITFPDAFWVNVLATADLSVIKSSTRLALAEDTFAGYTNWLSPSYSVTTNPSRWPQEIWNLAAFSPAHRKPTILFYTYGPCSAYLTTLVHHESPEEHYRLLNEFFKPYYSLLPNYSSDNPNCTPKAILSTEWQRDELSGYGSYCNIQVGAKEADKDIEAMRQGVPERRLWFCGEHTSPTEELGTVAGAYLSAEGVAGRLLREYGIEWKAE